MLIFSLGLYSSIPGSRLGRNDPEALPRLKRQRGRNLGTRARSVAPVPEQARSPIQRGTALCLQPIEGGQDTRISKRFVATAWIVAEQREVAETSARAPRTRVIVLQE